MISLKTARGLQVQSDRLCIQIMRALKQLDREAFLTELEDEVSNCRLVLPL